jgi:hypothetical protein
VSPQRVIEVKAASQTGQHERAAWHGENELVTEVNQDFRDVTLLHGVKSLTRFSNELARASVVALDAALRDKMLLKVAGRSMPDVLRVGCVRLTGRCPPSSRGARGGDPPR